MPEDQSDALGTFRALLDSRHSCRGFLPDPVSREIIKRIVETAQRVPSWCNAQPWRLVVAGVARTDAFRAVMTEATQGRDAKPDIAFPVRYSGEYKERRSVCGWQLYGAVGVERGDREGAGRQSLENFRLFGAPHVAIVTSPAELGTYGVLDCGAFVTAFTLAAQALGVASIPQAAIAAYSDVVRDFFDISEDRHVVCAISFGMEDAGHPANGFRTKRAAVAEMVDWHWPL